MATTAGRIIHRATEKVVEGSSPVDAIVSACDEVATTPAQRRFATRMFAQFVAQATVRI